MYAVIRAIRRKESPESTTVLKDVLAHPSTPDFIKAEALRAVYQVTGDEVLVRPWIESEHDHLRAASLEILVPVRIGDPSLDEVLDRMMAKKRQYSQTQTGIALAYVQKLREFRKGYDAETDPKKKNELLVSSIRWLCDDPPAAAGEEWHISNNAFSQYLLREFRRMVAVRGALSMRSAILQYADKNPKWKQLAQVLIKMLGAGQVTETNKEVTVTSAE